MEQTVVGFLKKKKKIKSLKRVSLIFLGLASGHEINRRVCK